MVNDSQGQGRAERTLTRVCMSVERFTLIVGG